MKVWLKGGLIAVGIFLVLYAILFFFRFEICSNTFKIGECTPTSYNVFLLVPGFLILAQSFESDNLTNYLMSFAFSFMFYFLVGVVIGLIVQIIKKSSKTI